MIVCFRCTAETKENLDRLLATGAYGDIGEVIAAAVRNQVLMEQEVAEQGAIVIGGKLNTLAGQGVQTNGNNTEGKDSKQKAPMKRVSNGKRAKKGERSAPAMAVAAEKPEEPCEPHVPQLFRLDGFPLEEPKELADLPPDLWSHGQTIPLDRWVLGQHNRLLPAKANARGLVRLFMDGPKGLNMTEAARSVAEQAAVLGDYLRCLDARYAITRDEALATAFPTTDAGEESWAGARAVPQDVMRAFLADRAAAASKSRARYANQFVVYQNGKGELSGLMVDLKMINVVQLRKERRIVPTRVAWEFAALTNPVLDGTSDGLPEKFSTQERAFLIAHILRSVPVEAFAYRVILEAVRDGQTSPEQIDAALKVHLDEERAEDLSQSFLASQRSGAVSRMSDLGLIGRRREGVRVNYAATEEGMAFLNQCTENQPR
jgi:hypothetical protein